jgi:thiol peroxidase
VRIALAVIVVAALACSKSEPAKSSGEAPTAANSPAATEPVETAGLIGRGDTGLTLLGKPLEVGDKIPDFDLAAQAVDSSTGAPEHVAASDLQGKVLVVSVVPSIDTRVCEQQTGHVAEKEPNLPEGVEVITISRDLPFAQRRFLEDNQFKTRMASDYRGGTFGERWGLVVKETGLLARSVWVIDQQGVVRYRELVADQSTEPDYEALWAAAAEVAGG